MSSVTPFKLTVATIAFAPPSAPCTRTDPVWCRRSLAQAEPLQVHLRDTELFGLGALDDMLAARVRFPNLQHVDIVVNGPIVGRSHPKCGTRPIT